jgi:hypothetical protein
VTQETQARGGPRTAPRLFVGEPSRLVTNAPFRAASQEVLLLPQTSFAAIVHDARAGHVVLAEARVE